MNPHTPGSKPIDPDTDEEGRDEVRKRDLPGNPLGPDHPQKPEDSPAKAGIDAGVGL